VAAGDAVVSGGLQFSLLLPTYKAWLTGKDDLPRGNRQRPKRNSARCWPRLFAIPKPPRTTGRSARRSPKRSQLRQSASTDLPRYFQQFHRKTKAPFATARKLYEGTMYAKTSQPHATNDKEAISNRIFPDCHWERSARLRSANQVSNEATGTEVPCHQLADC
jgi:hypothetical protein